MKKNTPDTALSDSQLEYELQRTIRKRQRWHAIRSVLVILLVLSATCVLAVGLWFPIYRVTGRSMEPSLQKGQLLAAYRTDELAHGDIAVFFKDNQILIKRVIGVAGDVIAIDTQGQVFRNGEVLNEPYIVDAALGFSDQIYPYEVPQNCYFVMGDHRAESIDSRMASVGCIDKERIAGKIVLRIWPIREVMYFGWEGAR